MTKRKRPSYVQYIIYVAIAILLVLIVTRQNERGGEDDAFGTATLTGEEQTAYYFVSLYGDIIDTDSNGAQIVITGVDEPDCMIFDDETTLEITLNIPDINVIPLEEDISLADDTLISTDINMTCVLCEFEAGEADYTIDGAINFAEFSSDFAEGELSLIVEGDIPATDDTTFAQNTTLEVEIPLFRAPVNANYCDRR